MRAIQLPPQVSPMQFPICRMQPRKEGHFMCSRCDVARGKLLSCLVVFALALNLHAETNRVLRVAADPNNLPFSNNRGEGFENKIAELIAHELNAKLEYVWHAQRRGF